MRALAEENFSRLFRFILGEPAANPVDSGYYEGPAMVTNLQITGAGAQNSTGSVTIQSDGEFVWTDLP